MTLKVKYIYIHTYDHQTEIYIRYNRSVMNSKRNAKNDFILRYFEKGAWYTLMMNDFMKRAIFCKNLNKMFIVINTVEVAEIQVLTLLLS